MNAERGAWIEDVGEAHVIADDVHLLVQRERALHEPFRGVIDEYDTEHDDCEDAGLRQLRGATALDTLLGRGHVSGRARCAR